MGFPQILKILERQKGLNKEVIQFISNIKKEPQWMLDWRLKAYERLLQLKEPDWQNQNFRKSIIKTCIIILLQKVYKINQKVLMI